MTYGPILLPRAEADVDSILGYLSERSRQGAASWAARWHDVLLELQKRPLSLGLAPEAADYDVEIRQILFKTRRGRVYRALFQVVGAKVYIMHVRGHGQDLLPPQDLQLPPR